MLNCVTLMGRLTAEPVLKVTPSGKDVCSFSIAVDRSFSSDGQRKADFINIVTWENCARFVSTYFKKGQMIALTGSIQTRSYEDKSGSKRTAFEVLAKEVSFCGSKAEGEGAKAAPKKAEPVKSGYYSNATPEDFESIGDDEDLPF